MENLSMTFGFFKPLPAELHDLFLFYATLVYACFVLHIIAVNTVLGLCLLRFWSMLKNSFKNLQSSKSVDDNLFGTFMPKGVAFTVNLGVPPLLFTQLLYGAVFYSSSILMGMWWIGLIGLIIFAYYGLYIVVSDYKYKDKVRFVAMTVSVILLLFIASIFVSNMSLLQNSVGFVKYGENSSGTIFNWADPTFVPRYLHVIVSSLAVGGLVVSLYSSFCISKLEKGEGDVSSIFKQKERKVWGLKVFIHSTFIQFLVGVWFLLSLSKENYMLFLGSNYLCTGLFALSLVSIICAIVAAFKQHILATVSCFLVTILGMCGMRFMLRYEILSPLYVPSKLQLNPGGIIWFVLSLVVLVASILYIRSLVKKTQIDKQSSFLNN